MLKFPKTCTDCRLHRTRTKIVWGSGSPYASLAFIGEGPGHDEDLAGEAFVGKAGQLLTKVLKLLSASRQDVLILNLVKCRPPNNRNPKPDEIITCHKWLSQQLALAKNVKVIVALGRVPWFGLTGEKISVTANRGTIKKIGKYKIIYTYHPSYLLRNRSPKVMKDFIRDIRTGLKLAKMR